MEILAQHSEGVILLTGCVQGQLAQLIVNEHTETAEKHFERVLDIMPDGNVYIELQNHLLDQELDSYPQLAKFAERYQVPVVATNDCHYVKKTDHVAHDVMMCVQMRKKVSEEDRIKFDNHFYFKSVDEMREIMDGYPTECIENAFAISDRCDISLETEGNALPKYTGVPADHTEHGYLRKLCYEGLHTRYAPDGITDAMEERMEHELKIIEQTGYSGYFLVVWDYANFAHQNGYPLSARGSAGGSLALYSLGVIDFNPMDHDCLFERFLNLDRISMPDIDVDFGDEIRDKVIDYVSQKYGESHVARVATFSKLSAKSLINDVGRTLEIPLTTIRQLSKEINDFSDNPLKSLEKKIANVSVTTPGANKLKHLVPICEKLDGIKRHVSCHASAIVITDKPLMEQIPLFKDKNDLVTSQFDGNVLEKLGMVKFDFLGSKSLMQIHKCIAAIKENHNIDIKLSSIPLEDEKTYELVNAGLLEGLFQLEGSAGVMRMAADIKPKNFAEFLTISALYRPGPLKSGMARQYIDRKAGREPVTYLHELAKDTLEETYGVCLYQEQVMKVAQDVAGFTPGQADVLRSAIGKLDKDLLKAQRSKFVSGAVEKGVGPGEAESIFTKLEAFGGYGFNKSHTVAYSLLTYRQAYLKTYYPREFMAGAMTRESSNETKIARYLQECGRLEAHLGIKIEILPPHVNYSRYEFTVEGDDIRMGLGCIKHVSDTAITAITEERSDSGEYKSLEDFCKRLTTKKVTKKALESLIKSGAADGFEGHRAQLLQNLPDIIGSSKKSRDNSDTGQVGLFEMMNLTIPDTEAPKNTLEDCDEWTIAEKCQYEKEVIGFTTSPSPLKVHQDLLDNYTTTPIDLIGECEEGEEVILAGIVANKKDRKTKRGNAMITFDLEGITSKIDSVLFPTRTSVIPKDGDIVLVTGTTKSPTNWDSESFKLAVKSITKFEDIENLTTNFEIVIPEEFTEDEPTLRKLFDVISVHPGQKTLLLHMKSEASGSVLLRASERFGVSPNKKLIEEVDAIFGEGSAKASNLTERLGEITN